MTITAREYQPADALEIFKGSAKQPGAGPDTELAEAKKAEGPTVTFMAGDRVIGCAGLTVIWDGFAEGWCLFVDDLENYPMVSRVAKHKLAHWIKQYNLVRVQAPLRADFEIGVRFAQWLGFTFEGCMRKYHPDGCDALMYSIIVEE